MLEQLLFLVKEKGFNYDTTFIDQTKSLGYTWILIEILNTNVKVRIQKQERITYYFNEQNRPWQSYSKSKVLELVSESLEKVEI